LPFAFCTLPFALPFLLPPPSFSLFTSSLEAGSHDFQPEDKAKGKVQKAKLTTQAKRERRDPRLP
jgi:hypothetical protein